MLESKGYSTKNNHRVVTENRAHRCIDREQISLLVLALMMKGMHIRTRADGEQGQKEHEIVNLVKDCSMQMNYITTRKRRYTRRLKENLVSIFLRHIAEL